MAIHSLWHVGFSVRDIEESIRFYTEGLGLTLVHRQSQDNEYTRTLVGYPDANLNIAQFALPTGEAPPSGHLLELIEYVTPRGAQIPPENSRIASGHLAIEVDDMEAMVDRLHGLGARFVSEPVAITAGINQGGRTVYLYDPDGVTLELLQPRRLMPSPKLELTAP